MKDNGALLKTIFGSKLTICLVLTVFFGLMAIDSARGNYKTMVTLREAVITADKEGVGTEEALQKLRSHVYGHMNTDLSSGDHAIKPPIQLKYQYERLLAAEQARVKVANEAVQAAGESICSQQYSDGGFNPNRVACVQAYVSENAVKEKIVPDDLYKFDFASPTWTPDRAGWSIVLASIFGAISIVLMVTKLIKRQTRPLY